MKKHLTLYLIMIVIFVVYNQFFRVEDPRLNTAINIIMASVIFLYIAIMAFLFLRNMRKK